MRRSIAIITILIYAFTCTFNSNAIGNSEEMSISCPQEKNIYMCEPTTVPPPMKIEDFSVGNEVFFDIKKTSSTFKKYAVTQYDYTFKDIKGNQTSCSQKYFIPKETIDKPTLNKTINICQSNPFTLIDKPYEDNYYFYADYKGSVGKLVSSCENSDIWCLASDLGLNTTKTGTHKFWVTNVVKEQSKAGKQGYWCESEPVLVTMKVSAKPSAVLKTDPITMEMGEFMNLMDMVEENHSGSWKGENIFSFKSVTDEQYFYYFPRKTGLHKLFYTVDNGACKTTYTMVIEVFSPRMSADGLNKDNFTLFPNPTSGSAFVNLSNSLDVEHTISVFDLSGKKHFSLTANDVNNSMFELEVDHLSKGMYIVEVRNSFKVSSKKLMVE